MRRTPVVRKLCCASRSPPPLLYVTRLFSCSVFAILAQVNGLTWPKRYFLSHPKACLGGHSAVNLGRAFVCPLGFLPPWLGSCVDGLPLWWASVAWKSSSLLFTIQHNGIHEGGQGTLTSSLTVSLWCRLRRQVCLWVSWVWHLLCRGGSQ